MPDRPTRPGRRCARVVLALLRDGRTRPDEWDRRERSAVTRLHAWAHRHGAVPAEPVRDPARAVAADPNEPEHRCPTCGVRLAEPIGYGPSDGYLPDAEQWEPDPSLGASPEVVALMRLDRILGNEHSLTQTGTGRVRGVVLDALRAWHKRQPDLDEPLDHEAPPEETLGSQVGRLADWIMEHVPGEPSQSQGAVDTALRLLDAWQPAAQTVYRREVEEQTARAEREHAARLRAESLLAAQQETTIVLRGHLDAERQQREEQQATLDLYRHRYGSRLEWTVDDGPTPPAEPVELYVPVEARVTWDGRALRALYLRPHDGTVGSEEYADGKGRPLTMQDLREERGDARPVVDARTLGRLAEVRLPEDDPVPHEPVDLRPVEEDPRRPHLNDWPDDAVLLRYAELRRLVSLHLERYADARTARAMLEGDVPLRLSEVLDR